MAFLGDEYCILLAMHSFRRNHLEQQPPWSQGDLHRFQVILREQREAVAAHPVLQQYVLDFVANAKGIGPIITCSGSPRSC